MKRSRIIPIIIIFILFLATALFSNKIQATLVEPVLYFGIAEIRTTTNMGYAMGDPNQGAKKIWKIVQYSGASSNDPTEVSAYCIDAETGFSNTGDKAKYDVSYNMKTESGAITAQNDILNKLVNGGQYDNLLALGDLLYVKGVSTEAERKQLLDASGANDIVENSDFNSDSRYYITDDEIDTVQQAAIWYFTNGQDNAKYDVYNSNWAWYTTASSNGTYTNFSSYNPSGIPYASAYAGYYRQQQMKVLYDYLIDTAKTNASNGINDQNTILTVYASSEDRTAQPIMQVAKLPREFDLSLRKYITKVNDTEIANSRVPNIDLANLNNESKTTATYKHRKDPVEVKLNDTITYNITIYNEGEQAGRATKVVDQLPTGLEFVEVVSGNFEKSSYNTQNNTLYLTRKTNNTTNLPAYTEGNLSSETIQIKCKVTATGDNTDKILTNIAWISEEIDADGNVITNQAGEDRDSEPSTITTKTKDQLVTTDNGYIGNSSNNGKDLTNSQNYFEGQQDDDDFEKVIIRAVTSIDVSKKWDDEENQDGKRVGTVVVELLRNGASTGQTVTLTEKNNWTGKFENLPTKIDGNDVTYSVKETTSINGYQTAVTSTDNTNGKSFTITNSYTPEETQITATKVWEDNNNQDGKRAPSVEFELYKNGIATGTKKTLTENNWTVTFDNLPVYEDGNKITYTVKEVNVPSGYTSSGEGTEENSYTITNSYTPDTTQITVTKQWEDNNNQDGKRPTTLKIELYKKVGNGAEEFVRDATMTGTGNTWAGRFTDLPVYENGEKITYIVREVNENGNLDEYISSGDATEENNYTLINTHKIFDLSLRKYITKVGNTDINNRNPNISTDSLGTGTTATYNHRKDPVVVKTGDTVIYNLTIYNEGEKTGRATKIVDQLPSGLTYVGLVDDSIFTVETYDIGTNTIYFIRQDSNTDNLDAYNGGTTLDSETIQVVCEVTATAGNEDTIFTNVAWISEEYDAEDDKIITTEEKADTDSEPGTTPEVNKDDLVTTDDGYIGNENNQGKDLSSNEEYFEGEQDDDDFEKIILEAITQVQVNKVWNDNNNQDGLRPGDIEVELLKNGEGTGNTVTLNDGNNWTATFDNLPINENGEKITYTVSEIKVDGYAVNITQNGENNFTITNTHTPGVTSVSVNKVWDDQDDQDGLRPESVVIELLKNGESLDPQQTVTLNEENHWTGTFNNLPIKENGVEVEYTVREITQIEGYETTIVDDSTGEEINNELASVNGETTIATYATRSIVRATSENVEPKNFTVTNTHIVEEEFDLALRKFIVAVSGDETIEESEILKTEDGTAYAREPIVDTSKLNTTDVDGNTITTAIYNHTKEPVLVKKNDIVVYMLRVYNEGEQDGYAAEIKDYLPPYLEFVDGEFNSQYGWEVSEDGRAVTTRYLENSVIAKPQTDESGNNTLSYVQVPIMCRVSDSANANENITNIADITEYQDKDKQPVEDRDSEQDNVKLPNDENLPGYKDNESNQDYVPGQEDDDDFEKIYVEEDKEFDLALRKFISEVDETLYNRAPSVDLSGLVNGSTAIYNHTKDPVLVKRNSVIIYTIRVYNEGEIDGYAQRITDYLPEELEFLPEHEINLQYEWQISEDGRIVTTDYLSSAKETEERQNKMQAFDGETLDYKEVQIACKVKEDVGTNVKLTNLAEITEDENEEGIPDRDSTPDNVEIPGDEELPGYKDDEIDQDYVPGQEDDDDFEKVIIQDFDLALRKFITKVDEEEVTTRIPEVSYDREQDEITYNHTKDPVEVITGNVVEYTIRVYNEGDMAGYAEEVADDIPDGLRYLPENETNIEYRWVMYDAEGNVTDNVEEAVEIRTDYLSKEQGENLNLLQAFNPEEEIGEGNPDYRDIKVAFEVVEPNESDRIIVNAAQITEDSDENGDPVEDIDSIPDEWNDGEDDQDNEYIKLTYFDLALRKWVTEAIVIENGQETITQTGHTAEMDPEPVVKVELYRKNINDVTVKFRYSIRITNEGDIAGYATEITDYVPEGLRFVAEDNPGWTDEGNNVISTRLLENTLLQPGESAEVEVVLTWINGEDNMGEMTNIAEISEDYNDKGAPDRDSTPDNQVEGEDDIDDAPVLLSIETGQERIYYVLGFTILGTLAGGLVLIKKFVI